MKKYIHENQDFKCTIFLQSCHVFVNFSVKQLMKNKTTKKLICLNFQYQNPTKKNKNHNFYSTIFAMYQNTVRETFITLLIRGLFIQYVGKGFRKTNISYPMIRSRTCAIRRYMIRSRTCAIRRYEILIFRKILDTYLMNDSDGKIREKTLIQNIVLIEIQHKSLGSNYLMSLL